MQSILCALFGAAVLLSGAACSGDDKTNKEDDTLAKLRANTEVRTEDGKIITRYDENGDGNPEVTKYYKEIPDKDDPSVIIRRIEKMEMDINSDGQINVIRHYGPLGKLESEEMDHDLNGSIDLISYYDGGELVRKEVFAAGTTRPSIVRHYSAGKVLRVEQDTNGDGKIDYWEYYEQGTLDRIGRDFNADGRADSWQTDR